MLPIAKQSMPSKTFWCSILLLALTIFTLPSYAANVVTSLSAQDMIKNIAGSIPNLTRMVTAFAYVLGIWFIITGIIKLKHAGEMRTQMSHEHSMKGPLVFMFVGACLLYLPSAVSVGLSSFWTNPTPFAYKLEKDEWSQFYSAVYLIIQFVGTIAFIRGLVLLSRLSGHSGQPGTFGKAMTHIIAGIFCINIYQFIRMIFATLGIFVNT